MKKLLTILGSVGLVSSSASPIMAMAKNNIQKNDVKDEKINLSTIKIPDSVYNAQGSTDLAAITMFALTTAASTAGESAQAFIADYLANPTLYTTIGGITEIPSIGDTLTFVYNVMANADNPLYTGLIAFNVTLINQTTSDKYDLSTIKNVIEKQLAANPDNISINTGGDKADDDVVANKTLEILDERLNDVGVNMFGEEKLLEMGYESNQLNVIASLDGKPGQNGGYFEYYKINISINSESEVNKFVGLDEPISFKVGVRMKDKIDIATYANFAKTFENEELVNNKKFTFATSENDFNEESVHAQEVIVEFDQYLAKIDEQLVVFNGELNLKNLQIAVEVSDFDATTLSRAVTIKLYASDKSHIFFMSGNALVFTYKIYANDYKPSTITFTFEESREIWEAGWLNDSYTRNESYKVLKWTNYASSWDEFLSKFGDAGFDKLHLKFDVYAHVTSTFGKGSDQTISGTADLKMSNITTDEKATDNVKPMDFSANSGTSGTQARFSTAYKRDGEYIYVNVYYYIQINCFTKNTTTMAASAKNVRFEAE